MAAVQPVRTMYLGFTGEINDANVTKLAMAMNVASTGPYDEIYLCINSNGGFVGPGIYLYNHIRGLRLPLTIHNTGNIHSVAFLVFLGAPTRYCSKFSTFMVHPTTASPPGGINEKKIQRFRTSILADESRTEGILRERAKLPARILSQRRVGDVQISPEKALEYDIVHEIREYSLPVSATNVLQLG